MYDSWKSRMELYMQNIDHGRLILKSVEHGPLIWPTIEENGLTRTKKYEELSATEKFKVAKDLWEKVQLLMQGTDNAKISRKRLKPDKHEHGNGIECAKAGECYQ
ncbi:hypothetical protein Tco_0901329, partial [Tanacetum coccineum]